MEHPTSWLENVPFSEHEQRFPCFFHGGKSLATGKLDKRLICGLLAVPATKTACWVSTYTADLELNSLRSWFEQV